MFRELTPAEMQNVAGGAGGSQAICASAATLAGGATTVATDNPAAGAAVGVATLQACNGLTSGGGSSGTASDDSGTGCDSGACGP